MRPLGGALAPLKPIYGDKVIKTAVYFGLDRGENILQVSWLDNTVVLTPNSVANVFQSLHIRPCSLQTLSNSSEHRTVFAFNQDYADERNVAAMTQDKHGLTQDMMSVLRSIYFCLAVPKCFVRGLQRGDQRLHATGNASRRHAAWLSSCGIVSTLNWHLPADVQLLYEDLNRLLRDEDREKLRVYFPYLKLLLTALNKLPDVEANVYRGVKVHRRGLGEWRVLFARERQCLRQTY